LLRGFDRDAVSVIRDHMRHAGTEILEGVEPRAIEKMKNGRFKVTFGPPGGPEGSEEFDTVLAG